MWQAAALCVSGTDCSVVTRESLITRSEEVRAKRARTFRTVEVTVRIIGTDGETDNDTLRYIHATAVFYPLVAIFVQF